MGLNINLYIFPGTLKPQQESLLLTVKHLFFRMKAALLLCFVGMTLASPGGYIAKGGVFRPLTPPEYLKAAESAGKFAWNKRFESELDTGLDTQRGERNAPSYVPTFFTSQTNHEQLTSSRTDNVRPQREIAKEPLYYETYHNRR